MRNLIYMTLLLLFTSPAVFANDESCGRYVSSAGVLVCPECVYADQYAQTGAAVARALGRSSIRVQNGRGSVQTLVTISPALKDTGYAYGVGFPFTVLYQGQFDDPTKTLVSSFPTRGRPVGAHYAPTNVANAGLSAKCEAMQDAAQREKNAIDRAEALAGDAGITSGMTYSEIMRRLRGQGHHSVRPPFRPDDCRNCTTESVPNSR